MKIKCCGTQEEFYEALEELYSLKEVDLKEVCKIVDIKYKELILGSGNLPKVEILKIAKLFSKVEYISEDNLEFYQSVSNYFLEEFKKLLDNQSEKQIYSVIVFISDIFSKEFYEALKLYIQRTMTSDTRDVDLSSEWVRSFEYFLLHVDLDIEFFISSIKELIEPNNFFSLPKNRQRAIFYWWLHVVWTKKAYMNHEKWKEFKEPLKILSDECLKRGEISTQMYIHFFAHHLLGNLFQTQDEWKWFNDSFNKPQSKAFKSLHVESLKEFKHKKKKIVFVKDRIVENAPYKVEVSLLDTLMRDENFVSNYEAYVLSLFYADKTPDEEKNIKRLESLGVKVVVPAGLEFHKEDEYYDHLKKAQIIREWFLQNEIDIMVGCVNGYDIMNYLFTSRVAKKQIYWSHGDFEYDVEGIDKRISHFYRDNPFEYEKFDVSILEEFHNPQKPEYKEEAQKIKKRWSKGTVILGSIGRLIKMDNDEYIYAVSEILKQNPDTIYLACGMGNEESIKEKLVKYNAPLDRFFFEGFVNAHVYGYVIDIYLNTFPEPSGEALGEFYSKGKNKLVVSMEV